MEALSVYIFFFVDYEIPGSAGVNCRVLILFLVCYVWSCNSQVYCTWSFSLKQGPTVLYRDLLFNPGLAIGLYQIMKFSGVSRRLTIYSGLTSGSEICEGSCSYLASYQVWFSSLSDYRFGGVLYQIL